MKPIVDMHCDLLCYLANDSSRSIFNPEVRCSLPQLQAGHVKLQTLAVFTESRPGSTVHGWNQIQQFKNLPQLFPQNFHIVKKNHPITSLKEDRIKILLAIENASGLFEENEPLTRGFQRLETIENSIGKVLYISLTWNLANRFGGGAHTSVGLQPDGEALLNFLHQRKIAVDLSHASDELAKGILNHIDNNHLNVPVIASHSNFRSVAQVPRNLPDDIALEILRREGLIGFVLCRDFIGAEGVHKIYEQMEHLLKLNGQKNCTFGADFFALNDLPPAFKKPEDQLFFPDYQNSSCYPPLLNQMKLQMNWSEEMLDDIAHHNFLRFYKAFMQ